MRKSREGNIHIIQLSRHIHSSLNYPKGIRKNPSRGVARIGWKVRQGPETSAWINA